VCTHLSFITFASHCTQKVFFKNCTFFMYKSTRGIILKIYYLKYTIWNIIIIIITITSQSYIMLIRYLLYAWHQYLSHQEMWYNWRLLSRNKVVSFVLMDQTFHHIYQQHWDLTPWPRDLWCSMVLTLLHQYSYWSARTRTIWQCSGLSTAPPTSKLWVWNWLMTVFVGYLSLADPSSAICHRCNQRWG